MAENLTQRQLAELTGYSYPTVNRALAGSGKVSPATRQKILDAAQRLGYSKNVIAQGLTQRRTFTIGVIEPGVHSFWTSWLSALERRLRADSYYVISCHRADTQSGSQAEIAFLLQRRVDGLIVVPQGPSEEPEVFRGTFQQGVPLLLVDAYLPEIPASFIGTDSVQGARAACRYLIELGHTRIAFVQGLEGHYSNTCRLAGYRLAMQEAGLAVRPEWVISAGSYREDSGEQAATAVLAASPRPTAIFAANDPLAFGLYKAFRRKRIKIPKDLSVVGYGGMPEGELPSPPLTTVTQNTEALGIRTAELMLSLIRDRPAQPVFEQLPDQLLIRESCAKPSR
ncbi:MAG: hypothetical protein A3K19_23010 [Lentisphaerae bacterium RIFOXYB12_FULL_65_16]|nr:MAG: hypothetical protein A3K18_16745 [Lentisphaerae bacterium RIFOXYA12_64_32]OGV90080.1 MAG: hypothetical protein A3K19_23010 [Lentisphaerae bacterium RIFOXYB12_FULL_65_16]